MYQNKISNNSSILWGLALLLLPFNACKEEDDQVSVSNRQTIGLEITETDGWETDPSLPLTRTMEAKRDDQTFYITASTVKGINTCRKEATRITRGIAKTGLTGNFQIMAYEYAEGASWSTQQLTYTEEAFTSNNQTWTLSNKRYWPQAGNVLRYVGISPSFLSGMTITPSIGSAGLPTIDLRVEKTVAAQQDVMAAISPEVTFDDHYGQVPMTFKHLLTCVKFAVGNSLPNNAVINTIRLKRVAQRGQLVLGNNSSWVADAASRTTFDMSGIDFKVTQQTTKNTIIAPAVTDGENQTTMLMIPQTFDNDNQVLEMIYTDASGLTHAVNISLKGQTWLPGTTVTYQISATLSDTERFLTVSSVVVGHQGGEASFGVTSYSTSGTESTGLPWRVVGYSLDEGQTWQTEKPAACNWIGIKSTSGNGSLTAERGTIVIGPQQAGTSQVMSMDSTAANYGLIIQSQQLNSHTPKGGSNDYYDLSTHDLSGNPTLRNTANCYVVNSAGYYKIPLVYGNAIKNGAKNTDVFADGVTKAVHSGNMTTPYLKDKATPTDGFLLWQDTEGLVSEEASNTFIMQDPEDHEYYLYFQIPQGTSLRPGNAVLAVSTGTTIMWSWHIWVTPIDVYSTVELTNAQGYKYNVMPIYLGWINLNGTTTSYASRSVLVKILQSSGLTAIMRITQLGGESIANGTRGYMPFWQWGRKDPLSPANPYNVGSVEGFKGSALKVYPTGGSYLTARVNNTVTIGYSIQHPWEFYYNSSRNWLNSTPTDLWTTTGEVGYVDSKVIKTIYDPCPVGFHVPTSNTFTGFTTTGANSTTQKQWMVANPTTNGTDYGFYYYTNNSRTESIFSPNNGYISDSGDIFYNIGRSGYSWLAQLGSGTTTSIFLDYRETRVYPFCTGVRGYGLGIWPVADD